MKVLLLGANGFIGSHLIEKILMTTDYNVTAFDLNDENLRIFSESPRFFLKRVIFFMRTYGWKNRLKTAM